MFYIELDNSRGVAEDHMRELQGQAKVRDFLAESEPSSPEGAMVNERNSLLGWLFSRLRREPKQDFESEPEYRHRPT